MCTLVTKRLEPAVRGVDAECVHFARLVDVLGERIEDAALWVVAEEGRVADAVEDG